MRLKFLAGLFALAATSFAPTTMVAQPGGVSAACNIDANSPKELALASLNIQKAKTAQIAAARTDALKSVLKELDTKPERFAKNPAGYNYILSQVLVLFSLEPSVGFMSTRGAIGMVTQPEQSYDLVAHLDEAFKAIVTAIPACANEVMALRQNDAWLALTRKALDASNSGQLDSAEFYANRSLILSRESPYPYYVLGNAANQRNDKPAAMKNWKSVIEKSGVDTSYRELKNGSMQYLGMSELEAAQGLKGVEQQSLARAAASRFKELLAISPDGNDAPNMMESWSIALKLAGDSAQIPIVYAPLLASPTKFTDFALTMGGVIATRINKTDDALTMFDAAVQKNPVARDALRNLAATYYSKDQFLKMFDPTAKLVAIDPNNFDAWMMYAYAAQGLAKGTKVPADRKAWTDSLVKYQTYAEALPVKVEVVGFQRTGTTSQLTLSLEQQAATPGSYSVTAEFLDVKGAVVASDTQKVGPLAKGTTKNVVFKVTGAGIVGYRYQKLK